MSILVLATQNKGKTKEIKHILKNFPITIKNLNDFGPIPEVEEDGETFDDNAYKKASFTARVLGYPAMADDSGLVVEALNGKPGVKSARYAGDNAKTSDNCEKLIKDMKDKKNRKAFFECVISIAVPTGQALTYQGKCNGLITYKAKGNNGFGYDPFFFYPDFNKTFAEISMEEKNKVSHRGKALNQVGQEFDKILKWIDMHKIQLSSCEKPVT
ncbi:MAG: Non-canonical purine NTP pyrophosphatase [Desulfobacteraceae bacterium 4572_130]|nr:MAG: Non-canonical purine NTP pyrophosphatase [Desulfobacteraceae bacterium 4572_130]